MPYSIEVEPQIGVLFLTYTGRVDLSDLKHSIRDSLKVAIENNCFLFLNDFLDATVDLKIFEIHNMPQILEENAAPHGLIARKLKRAAVTTVNNFSELGFADTVVKNYLQNVRIFSNRDEAKVWLLQDQASLEPQPKAS